MKRAWIIATLTLVLASLLAAYYLPFARATEKQEPDIINTDLYTSTITALLSSQISDAVANHYGARIRWDGGVKILKIHSLNDGGYPIELIIQVSPFVGPHVTVGMDNVTLWVFPSEARLVSFEHLKDFDLPERLQEDWYQKYVNRRDKANKDVPSLTRLLIGKPTPDGS